MARRVLASLEKQGRSALEIQSQKSREHMKNGEVLHSGLIFPVLSCPSCSSADSRRILTAQSNREQRMERPTKTAINKLANRERGQAQPSETQRHLNNTLSYAHSCPFLP